MTTLGVRQPESLGVFAGMARNHVGASIHSSADKKSLAGVFPSPARLNPQFSQPKVRRNYSGNLFSHQNSAVRKLYLENTSAGFTECSRGATKGDASFDMLMTAANEGRRLFAAKDCSAAGRCRVTGFQRPFLNSKKNLAGVFPSPARFNLQFSQPKVRRNTMKSSLSSLSS